MRIAKILALAIMVPFATGDGGVVAPMGWAQVADPDDDGDGGDGADGDDDAGVPDQDDVAGGDDGGAGAGGGDDGGTGSSDDGGSAGGSGDGGNEDDDGGGSGDAGGGGPAGGGSADDDDGDDDDTAGKAGSSGDDDGGSGGNGSRGGDDDDDDDAAERRSTGASQARAGQSDDDGDTAGDDGNDASGDDADDVQYIGGGEESEAQRVALDAKEGVETDREGFRYRRSEFVALDLDPREIGALRSKGFAVVRTERLVNAGRTLHLVKGPARQADSESFSQLDDIADPGSFSYNHLFDSSSGEVRKTKGATPRARAACGCQIGMVDTGVASTLPIFKHVIVEQRALNGRVVAPKQHGTAVAHQFAGTAPVRGKRTRIVVADIFSGPRATAGSTFALVQALDWLAASGVPVINVSLAGPRNAVVAGSVERLVRRGHVIVAAAGNDGPAAPPVFPGAYS